MAVTGAAGALGSTLCRTLVDAGAELLALDRAASHGRLEALAKDLGCRHAELDVADAAAWAKLAEAGLLQDLSGAVLVAGGWAGGKAFHEAPSDELTQQLQLNLTSAGVSMQALLQPMVQRGSGSLVVIGSKNAVSPELGAKSAAYTASKAGLVALAKAVAAELREQGVRVNAVLPSTIDTPANRGAMPGADAARWVSPKSLAEAICFLLSDASRDVSGAALPVYGRS
ncbi:MAG: SDR family oxidoreductase [Myxococcales bacterium]|nr:SDR family oxidoreductase [Myxococcales bacterium]